MIDGSKGAIPGAAVTVRNTATAVTRETMTDGQGLFVFTNLFAGTYDLQVTLTGFRTYEQKGIVLTATERVAVPPIVLEVGGLQEVVTVEASTLRAQAQSGERSGTIRADEIKDTQLRGRDFLGLLQGMPGVVDTNVRNAPGWNAFLGTQINGLSDQFMGMSYDGVVQQGHRIRRRQLRDPVARLDRGSEDSDVELPGRIRPRGRRQYHRRHQERQRQVQRIGGASSSVTKGSTPTPGTAGARATRPAGTSPLCATPRYRYDNSAYTLGGPGRSWYDRSTRNGTSCSSSTRWTSCREPIRSS